VWRSSSESSSSSETQRRDTPSRAHAYSSSQRSSTEGTWYAVCTNVTLCCSCWTEVHDKDDDYDDDDDEADDVTVMYFSHGDSDKHKHQTNIIINQSVV